MSRISIANTVLLFCTALPSQQKGGEVPKTGQIHGRIVCQHDETQSYALYLPSSYQPGKPCPVLFGFNPGANGRSVASVYCKAAERFGWIVVGSNNSRNGPATIGAAAGRAMWQDVHARFAVDDDRLYATGMSGGACVAAEFAQTMPQPFAGVFLHARGDLNTVPRRAVETFFVVAPGCADFNFEESVRFLREARKVGCVAHLTPQPGGHGWAPVSACETMVRYAEIHHGLSRDSEASAALATLIEQEIEHLTAELDGAFFWCAFERLNELQSKLRDRGKRTTSINRSLQRELTRLAKRERAEQAAWQQLERDCLFDAALFLRYPSIESVVSADAARRQLFREHPGTSAAYAAVLAQKNAKVSLARIRSHKPSPEVQRAYLAYLAKSGEYEVDFVDAAARLTKQRQPGRAVAALLAAFEAGQLTSKALRHVRLKPLRKQPGFRQLEESLSGGK